MILQTYLSFSVLLFLDLKIFFFKNNCKFGIKNAVSSMEGGVSLPHCINLKLLFLKAGVVLCLK